MPLNVGQLKAEAKKIDPVLEEILGHIAASASIDDATETLCNDANDLSHRINELLPINKASEALLKFKEFFQDARFPPFENNPDRLKSWEALRIRLRIKEAFKLIDPGNHTVQLYTLLFNQDIISQNIELWAEFDEITLKKLLQEMIQQVAHIDAAQNINESLSEVLRSLSFKYKGKEFYPYSKIADAFNPVENVDAEKVQRVEQTVMAARKVLFAQLKKAMPELETFLEKIALPVPPHFLRRAEQGFVFFEAESFLDAFATGLAWQTNQQINWQDFWSNDAVTNDASILKIFKGIFNISLGISAQLLDTNETALKEFIKTFKQRFTEPQKSYISLMHSIIIKLPKNNLDNIAKCEAVRKFLSNKSVVDELFKYAHTPQDLAKWLKDFTRQIYFDEKTFDKQERIGNLVAAFAKGLSVNNPSATAEKFIKDFCDKARSLDALLFLSKEIQLAPDSIEEYKAELETRLSFLKQSGYSAVYLTLLKLLESPEKEKQGQCMRLLIKLEREGRSTQQLIGHLKVVAPTLVDEMDNDEFLQKLSGLFADADYPYRLTHSDIELSQIQQIRGESRLNKFFSDDPDFTNLFKDLFLSLEDYLSFCEEVGKKSSLEWKIYIENIFRLCKNDHALLPGSFKNSFYPDKLTQLTGWLRLQEVYGANLLSQGPLSFNNRPLILKGHEATSNPEKARIIEVFTNVGRLSEHNWRDVLIANAEALSRASAWADQRKLLGKKDDHGNPLPGVLFDKAPTINPDKKLIETLGQEAAIAAVLGPIILPALLPMIEEKNLLFAALKQNLFQAGLLKTGPDSLKKLEELKQHLLKIAFTDNVVEARDTFNQKVANNIGANPLTSDARGEKDVKTLQANLRLQQLLDVLIAFKVPQQFIDQLMFVAREDIRNYLRNNTLPSYAELTERCAALSETINSRTRINREKLERQLCYLLDASGNNNSPLLDKRNPDQKTKLDAVINIILPPDAKQAAKAQSERIIDELFALVRRELGPESCKALWPFRNDLLSACQEHFTNGRPRSELEEKFATPVLRKGLRTLKQALLFAGNTVQAKTALCEWANTICVKNDFLNKVKDRFLKQGEKGEAQVLNAIQKDIATITFLDKLAVPFIADALVRYLPNDGLTEEAVNKFNAIFHRFYATSRQVAPPYRFEDFLFVIRGQKLPSIFEQIFASMSVFEFEALLHGYGKRQLVERISEPVLREVVKDNPVLWLSLEEALQVEKLNEGLNEIAHPDDNDFDDSHDYEQQYKLSIETLEIKDGADDVVIPKSLAQAITNPHTDIAHDCAYDNVRVRTIRTYFGPISKTLADLLIEDPNAFGIDLFAGDINAMREAIRSAAANFKSDEYLTKMLDPDKYTVELTSMGVKRPPLGRVPDALKPENMAACALDFLKCSKQITTAAVSNMLNTFRSNHAPLAHKIHEEIKIVKKLLARIFDLQARKVSFAPEADFVLYEQLTEEIKRIIPEIKKRKGVLTEYRTLLKSVDSNNRISGFIEELNVNIGKHEKSLELLAAGKASAAHIKSEQEAIEDLKQQKADAEKDLNRIEKEIKSCDSLLLQCEDTIEKLPDAQRRQNLLDGIKDLKLNQPDVGSIYYDRGLGIEHYSQAGVDGPDVLRQITEEYKQNLAAQENDASMHTKLVPIKSEGGLLHKDPLAPGKHNVFKHYDGKTKEQTTVVCEQPTLNGKQQVMYLQFDDPRTPNIAARKVTGEHLDQLKIIVKALEGSRNPFCQELYRRHFKDKGMFGGDDIKLHGFAKKINYARIETLATMVSLRGGEWSFWNPGALVMEDTYKLAQLFGAPKQKPNKELGQLINFLMSVQLALYKIEIRENHYASGIEGKPPKTAVLEFDDPKVDEFVWQLANKIHTEKKRLPQVRQEAGYIARQLEKPVHLIPSPKR